MVSTSYSAKPCDSLQRLEKNGGCRLRYVAGYHNPTSETQIFQTCVLPHIVSHCEWFAWF